MLSSTIEPIHTHPSPQCKAQGEVNWSWIVMLCNRKVCSGIHTKDSAAAAEGSCCRHALRRRWRKAIPKSWHGWHRCRISPKGTHSLHGQIAFAKCTILCSALIAAGNKIRIAKDR